MSHAGTTLQGYGLQIQAEILPGHGGAKYSDKTDKSPFSNSSGSLNEPVVEVLYCIFPDRYITKIDSFPSQHQVSDGMSKYFLILKVL